jgi:hypothetical protein
MKERTHVVSSQQLKRRHIMCHAAFIILQCQYIHGIFNHQRLPLQELFCNTLENLGKEVDTQYLSQEGSVLTFRRNGMSFNFDAFFLAMISSCTSRGCLVREPSKADFISLMSDWWTLMKSSSM